MYTVSGGRSRGKIVSSLRKRFGARQRNPLHDYLYVYICILYIYTHISGNSHIWDIVHTLYVLYHINICATTLSHAHVDEVTKATLLLEILCNTPDASSQH